MCVRKSWAISVGIHIALNPFETVTMIPGLPRSCGTYLIGIGGVEVVSIGGSVITIERDCVLSLVREAVPCGSFRRVAMVSYSTRSCGTNLISICSIEMIMSIPVAIQWNAATDLTVSNNTLSAF